MHYLTVPIIKTELIIETFFIGKIVRIIETVLIIETFFYCKKTVRIIETVLIAINQTRVRLYGTYNRDVVENFETVLIIESVLIIGT